MNRQDRFLLFLGPCVVLLIWALLPGGRSEAARTSDGGRAGVIAELVGYAIEARPDGRPRLLGRSAEAELRLHDAPVAARAAWLTSPAGGTSWTILPAGPGRTVRLLGEPSRSGARPRRTSIRPWARARGDEPRLSPDQAITLGCGEPAATVTPARLHGVRLPAGGAAAAAEPEILWLEAGRRQRVVSPHAGLEVAACGDGTVRWRPSGNGTVGEPCTGAGDGWQRAQPCWLWRSRACLGAGAWGANLRGGDAGRLLLPWGSAPGPQGSWLTMSGSTPESIRVGVAGNGTANAEAATRPPVCAGGGGQQLASLEALELRAGDLLALGRTRFLVHLPARQSRLELHHVRDPDAPGHFRASSGHDVYHPNRRALWQVPDCSAQDPLTLLVEPGDDAGDDASDAERPLVDRRRRSRIAAAARDHGVPHQLPAVATGRVRDPALLSLCHRRGPGRDLGVHLVADSSRGISLRAEAGAIERTLRAGSMTLSIGSAAAPGELLLELDGNLLRVAPAAAPRVTRRTRLGLAAYLIFVLTLQAVPLTLVRIRRRRRAARTGAAPAAVWPAGLAAPTLQQVAGIAIAGLLFLGTSFHLVLGLHPELAGKPDYLQAFLQGSVAVCAVLAAGAGFAFRRRLEHRCAGAGLGAALALLAAAGWWWWDGLGSSREAWLSAWRDRASASAGAAPAMAGELWLTAGLVALGTAAALMLAARLRWSRLAEHAAGFALRAPLAGFATVAAAGLAVGIVQRSALAFELALLSGLAWYAAAYWAFVRHGRRLSADRLRRRAASLSMASGLLMLLFLVLFFAVGANLPDGLSWACVVLGLATAGAALRLARETRSTGLLRVVSLWVPASISGLAFASFVLTDMGSVAAWLPALATGFFLWLVRPEEAQSRPEEPCKAWSHVLLALGSGLVLLGLLDVFKHLVQGLEWRVLDRPRQRLALAEDVSYITSGEWITQVRWLASRSEWTRQDDALQWVPNVNSDVAIFGLAANLGFGWAVAASIALLAVAGCAALAADQALRQARAAADLAPGDRLGPTLGRACGLLLGMAGVLLICQWLVHLATGVVLHLPITGLVFPWISHGNTTHVLFTAAVLLPMAGIGGSGEGGG